MAINVTHTFDWWISFTSYAVRRNTRIEISLLVPPCPFHPAQTRGRCTRSKPQRRTSAGFPTAALQLFKTILRMAAVDFALKPFEQFPVQETYFFHSDKEEEQSREHFSTTVPTFDIWKKFELTLPTPPRSPSRSEPDSPVSFDLEIELDPVTDTLEMVTEIADDPSQTTMLVAMSEGAISTRSLKSKLIQDCMWNGSSYEAVDVSAPAIEDYYDTPCSTPPPVEYVSSECVDPSTVFPYPMNDTQICGSQQCSDSEEEIDVVTIEKPRKRSCSETSEQVVSAKRLRLTITKGKPVSPPPVTAKIIKRQVSTASSTHSGSDEEDSDKRATHNVLERKRRNDLKTSFHSLRDEVPEIKDNERAPKVLILKKAKDHIKKLVNEEEILLGELEKEKDRHKKLQDKFYLLGQKRK